MEKITYRQIGDYLIPNLEFPEIHFNGKYARLRDQYLLNQEPAMHGYLILTETLEEHCNEIGRRADKMEKALIEQMIKAEPMLTEELKAQDQMKWVGLMNNIRHSAEEIVLKELIYT